MQHLCRSSFACRAGQLAQITGAAALTSLHPTPNSCSQDWAKQLDYEDSLRRQQAEGQAAAKGGAAPGQPSKGFLGLTSKVDLNSMDVDLSEQLRVRKKSGGEAAPSGQAPRVPRRRAPPKFDSVPSTRVEKRAWERGGKFSRKVVATAPTNEADQVLQGGALSVGDGRCSCSKNSKTIQRLVAGLGGCSPLRPASLLHALQPNNVYNNPPPAPPHRMRWLPRLRRSGSGMMSSRRSCRPGRRA